jgi:nucleoside-diphosphate-sugar epimerase
MTDRILITGALGQIGTELATALRNIHGTASVITTDIKQPETDELKSGPHEILDVTDINKLNELVTKHGITQVYHLAAILSASGERNPIKAWQINMNGVLNVLEACVTHKVKKLFWPSTIAVFGNTTPKQNTPQHTIAEPVTVYGISKLAGEGWCNYYFEKEGLDVRSIRYPGLISYKSKPGGGTTDYAVEVFYEALQHGRYECFLAEDTRLPMMYMPDAIRGTLELMNAPAEKISVRTSYNFSAFSFSPKEIAAEIKKHIPAFDISYHPDFRQELAASWPQSIDDTVAQTDWNWKPEFDLAAMTTDMLKNVKVDENVG